MSDVVQAPVSRAWRAHEQTQCDGKERFGSANLAHRVAKRRTERERPSSVYRCNVCGGWHIGGTTWSKPSAKGRGR